MKLFKKQKILKTPQPQSRQTTSPKAQNMSSPTPTPASTPSAATSSSAGPSQFTGIAKPPQHTNRKEENFKWMRFLAELIGSFAITFVIVAVNAQLTTVGDPTNQLGYTEIILAQTFVYAAFYAAFRYVSGGHFNPAVTLTYMILFEITQVVGILYILFQLIGGILGGLLAWGVFTTDLAGPVIDPSNFCGGNANCTYFPGQGRGFLIELIGTTAVIVIFTLIDLSRSASKSGYLAIGLVYGAFAYALKAFSGAYFNPAVALGAAVAAQTYNWSGNYFWIFIIAPVVSAVIAALVYGFAFQLPGDGCGPHLQFFSKDRKKIHLVIE